MEVVVPADWNMGMDGNAHPRTGPNADWAILILHFDGSVTWRLPNKEKE